ncbi:chymotrypsin-like isoform X2 [Anthonomus grandis grandis]|uniref:chymotrypsin-like isoform X2 n=1 Tax=Anthonomus grandis grandis TaxID=2921223 RepID=UPI0021650CFB|nr:chymotrypsin-like isoform X2 [Anthonomus grandis grandis]
MKCMQCIIIWIVIFQLSQQALQNRIINGQVASIEDYPYQVLVVLRGNSISDWNSCGGSIISKNYILTAGHCVTKQSNNKRTWDHVPAEVLYIFKGYSSLSKVPIQSVIQPRKIILHPGYNVHHIPGPNGTWLSEHLVNDIALLYLKNPLTFSKTINKIRLASQDEPDSSFCGKTAVVTGFGLTFHDKATEYLHAVNVTLPAVNKCESGFICVSYGIPPRGSCRGDSGGPVAINGKQYGIVSSGAYRPEFSKMYCEDFKSAYYVNIIYYRKWISENSDVDEEN